VSKGGEIAGGHRYLPAAVLALLALIWGYNWVVMKVGLQDAPPFTFATLRNLLAALTLFAVLAGLRRPLRPPRPLGLVLLLGLLQTTGFVGLTMWALESGGAGKIAMLTYTMPFWLLVLAWPLLGERLTGLQWAAVTVSALGLLLVLGPWQLRGLTSSLLAVAGGLSWAASAVVAKVIHRRDACAERADLLSLTTWQMLLGTVPLGLIALVELDDPIVWSGAFVGALAFNVLLANALAWVLWLWILRALPAGIAGLGTLAIPVVGVISAAVQLGERPSPVEAGGMALIVAALALLSAATMHTHTRLAPQPRSRVGRPPDSRTQKGGEPGGSGPVGREL
jgi:drug/metabolite transporter (DMT)-like permease